MRIAPACRMTARKVARKWAASVRASTSGEGATTCQFWPNGPSGSGGAPMVTPSIRSRVRPGLRTVRDHAGGEIRIEPDPHARPAGALVGLRQLAVGEPLQEGLAVDAVTLLVGQTRHLGGVRPAPFRPPGLERHRLAVLEHHQTGQHLEPAELLELQALLRLPGRRRLAFVPGPRCWSRNACQSSCSAAPLAAATAA